ncbi:hypothetical protein GQR58_030219 [Nymphon striatum]|nr:hypothetical protein GQR58_030219 [Nymphon striatum]
MREKDKIEILKDILFAEEHEFEEKIAQRVELLEQTLQEREKLSEKVDPIVSKHIEEFTKDFMAMNLDLVFETNNTENSIVPVEKSRVEKELRKYFEGTDDIATIRNSYLLGTHGAVFVFDVSRPSTFEHLKDDLKIISDKMPKIQKGVFDLHKFFELLIFTYKAKAKEKGLKFDCLWDEKIPKLVEGDRLRTLSNRNQFDR